MKVTRGLAALAGVMAIAACGGSHHRVPLAHGQAPAPPPPSSTLDLVLPASAAGPTTCTVYESGFGTQVVFDSESLNVTGECEAWTSRQPGAGYLWAYQPTSAALANTAVPVCDLHDPSGRVTATVIDDTGFAPLSGAERTRLASACTSLSGAGWVRASRAAG